jgi:tRNA (guanine-N7-)-methyltransferase
MGNVAFIRTRVEFIESLFAHDEIDEIWITFADPQERKPRKRLTHPRFLESYRRMLAPGGIIHLKTDSRLLHHFTLETARCNGLTVLEHNEDIYGSGRADDLLSIQTFYEKNFLAQGIPITYLAFRLDSDKPLVEPEWDQEPYEQTYKTLTRS